MQNGFGETFWQTGLQNRSFGATALEKALGTTLGTSPDIAGEQLWGAALGSSFEEQLCTAALKNGSFGEHLWGVAFERFVFGCGFLVSCWDSSLDCVQVHYQYFCDKLTALHGNYNSSFCCD